MRILYLDAFSGISGDMLLGALIDLGVDPGRLRRRLAALPLRGYRIRTGRTSRQGIAAVTFEVEVAGGHAHRGWSEIRRIVERARLGPGIAGPALRIFRRLIEVEARIHRVPIEKVHLHEVGAVDAIVDIVGAVVALNEILGEDGLLHVSPLRLGGGMVTMEHGTFPIPAPATAALLEGIPVATGPVEGELVTPTGAAIVSTLAAGFGPMPPMTLRAVGYGAGSRTYPGHPNVLRAFLGESAGPAPPRDPVAVLECTIDDMNPQGYGYLMERLFAAGALEVFYTPVQMKKNRPGTLVTAIAPSDRFGPVAETIFRESTTIGLRYRTEGRLELAREIVAVTTRWGTVRVKVSSLDGAPSQAQPEYEDCRRIAAREGIPLKQVQEAALAAFRSGATARAAAGKRSPRRAPRGAGAAGTGRKRR